MDRRGFTPITTLQDRRPHRERELTDSVRAMRRAAVDHSELLLSGEELQSFVIAEAIRVLGDGPPDRVLGDGPPERETVGRRR